MGNSNFGRIFTPEGDLWAFGDKKEQKARAATKANEANMASAPAKAAAKAAAEADATAQAQIIERKKAMARSKSVYSTAFDSASLVRKTLLGQ